MTVEFTLLGDVTAHVDKRMIDLGHARQRCVLVALLVDVNRVVPADRLAERAWAGHQPQRARNTLSAYLSRLRGALAGAADVRITRGSSGYRLTADPMTIDLHRFRHLVAAARAAGDPEQAEALYAQALALWTGEPFTALDSPWLADLRTGLESERLAAELDHDDLSLARGEHVALLGDLTARAAAHPLDERIAGQLIRALYRCGRQADALQHYEALRRQLAEDLGASLGPDLQALHRQILGADPDLLVTAPASLPAPRQLPAGPRWFTGRQRELAELDAVLAAFLHPTSGDATGAQPAGGTHLATGNAAVVALCGTAGVGKTAAALHWAGLVSHHFPDGQLFANLHGFDDDRSPLAVTEVIRGFLDALGVAPHRVPADLDAQTALYRSLLSGRRVLVVLDNVRDTGHVKPLLPGAPGSLTIVTSRTQLTGVVAVADAHPLTLDLLPRADARDLLARRLGRQRLAAAQTAVERILDRCAGLPLALAIVAARAAVHRALPLETLATELEEPHDVLDALDDGDPGSDLRAALSSSYRALSSAAAALFRMLGQHPGPDITSVAAASLAGVPAHRARRLLAELTRAHLVAEQQPGRFSSHDLLRAYAASLTSTVDAEVDRNRARHRMLDHYLRTAYTAARRLDPHRDRVDLAPSEPGVTPEPVPAAGPALEWFRAEHRVLNAMITRAADARLDAHAWQLAWAMADYLVRQGHWHDLAAAYTVALAAAQRLGDRSAQAHAHRSLARAYVLLGRGDDARVHLTAALEDYRALGNAVSEASSHLSLAHLLERQGRPHDALVHDRRALALYRGAGHHVGHARALSNVSWHLALIGRHRQALAECRRALAIMHDLDDVSGQAGAWDTIGYAQHHLGDLDEAAESYRQAIERSRHTGDRQGEANTLVRLGETHLAAGRRDAARRAWHEALGLLERLDRHDATAVRAKLETLDVRDSRPDLMETHHGATAAE